MCLSRCREDTFFIMAIVSLFLKNQAVGAPLHQDVGRMLRWMGPMEELPPNLGWVRPLSQHEIA